MSQPILHLEGVQKRFGPVHALRGVELEVYAGEVHALIGENGAGKSTLMKVLSGAYLATAGTIQLQGRPYTPTCPQDGRKAGVAMIYQELTLAPHLTIEENIMLGMERTKFGFIRKITSKIVDALALLGQGDLSPKTLVGSLSIGTQQLVEIARAIVSDAKIIIMDESTSSLSTEDAQALFRVIDTLREQGIAIIYISHFLEEVQEISDRYTVLRDGETCGTGLMDSVSIPDLIRMMVGRDLNEMYPKVEHSIGEVVMSCERIRGIEFPVDASFQLHRGEILGIFGLVGAGRSELLRCIFGLDSMTCGTVELAGGVSIDGKSAKPKVALDAELDLLSEDRKTEGLAQSMSIAVNTTLSALYKQASWGFINLNEEKAVADKWAKRLGVKCHSTLDAINTLSGGNQQKVAIGRLMNHDSSIFFMDEPTRGIDVGSKAEIYKLIQELAADGKSVVIVSSYLPELQGVCDSLAVMYRGCLSAVKTVDEWSNHSVMAYATTGSEEAVVA
ncbi:MAG: sugar ABC transporter ATP-binding protein [Opitutaceae bacterium]